MNVHEYNRNAWNLQSLDGCRWSTPYPDEVIERAKRGDWSVILTPNREVPRDWFPAYPDLSGLKILALASGGGQQVPVFAAAGAEVTSFEASDVQLEKDEETCARHGLSITAIQGDMADLSELASGTFDLIFNPVSNAFAESLEPIWRECHRVLKPGGRLLCGFTNPAFYVFDHALLEVVADDARQRLDGAGRRDLVDRDDAFGPLGQSRGHLLGGVRGELRQFVEDAAGALAGDDRPGGERDPLGGIPRRHVSAERFVSLDVKTEPLDASHVLVLAGLSPGRRIVTDGAELIDQIR